MRRLYTSHAGGVSARLPRLNSKLAEPRRTVLKPLITPPDTEDEPGLGRPRTANATATLNPRKVAGRTQPSAGSHSESPRLTAPTTRPLTAATGRPRSKVTPVMLESWIPTSSHPELRGADNLVGSKFQFENQHKKLSPEYVMRQCFLQQPGCLGC